MLRHVVLSCAVMVGVTALVDDRAAQAQSQVKMDLGGAALFRTYCAACHGTGAKGDGPLADSLRRKPADLTTFAQRHGGKFDESMVGRIIDGRNPVKDHGAKDMPVWGDAFAGAVGSQGEGTVAGRVDALVKYLATIQVK